MSDENEAADTSSTCASCGITEIDDIKLKECDDCDLVKYCSDECKENHKTEHEEDCMKRAAELRDELLFKQPESSHLGDCPICMIPLSLNATKSINFECCSKSVCRGCMFAHKIREVGESICPFCRTPEPKTEEEGKKLVMKRIEANDPVAMCREGIKQCMQSNYLSAFEYFAKAAEFGNAEAHLKLACLYHDGLGVENDEGKAAYHLEEAAIGGHPEARFNLGLEEGEKGNLERAVKHWIIAAAQGYDPSIKMLLQAFKQEFVEKDDLTSALRAHKAAVDATKSPQRLEEEKFTSKVLHR